MTTVTCPIRKGEKYENVIGHLVEAPGDGGIHHCDFVAAEEMVSVLAALGWKCRKRKDPPDA